MARKPEIQYVGQFYIHGSEAQVLAPEDNNPKKSRLRLPQIKFQQVQNIYIDPIALCGMAVAVVMVVVMVFGALQIGQAWDQYEVMADYVSDLRETNASLNLTYRDGYDLEEIRATALSLGMVPVEELQTMELLVTMPQPEPEPPIWEEITWFLKGLFA